MEQDTYISNINTSEYQQGLRLKSDSLKLTSQIAAGMPHPLQVLQPALNPDSGVLDYYVWQNVNSTDEWFRIWMKRDTSQGTGMYGVKEISAWKVNQAVGIANTDSVFTGGKWYPLPGGSPSTTSGLLFYTVDGDSVSFKVQGPGDFYLKHLAGSNRGWYYVTVEPETDGDPVQYCLGISSVAHKPFINGWNSSNLLKEELVCTGMSDDTYQVVIQRSTTETSSVVAPRYAMYLDSYCVKGENYGIPYHSNCDIVKQLAQDVRFFTLGAFVNLTSVKPYTVESLVHYAGFSNGAITVGDYIYIGNSYKWSKLFVDCTLGNTVSSNIKIEYYNGTGWKRLSFMDTTKSGFCTLAQSGILDFRMPLDWVMTQVDGSNKYWVRLSVSASTSPVSLRFSQGTVNTGTLLKRLTVSGSQLEHAFMFVPLTYNYSPLPENLQTPQSVGGELHGGQMLTSMSIEISGIVQSYFLSPVAVNGIIAFKQGTNIIHNTCNNGMMGIVGSGSLNHTFSLNSFDVDWDVLWKEKARIQNFNYNAMFPGLYYDALPATAGYMFTKCRLFGEDNYNADLYLHSIPGGTAFNGEIKGAGCLYTSDSNDYFASVVMKDPNTQNINWNYSTHKTWVQHNPNQTPVGMNSSIFSKYYVSTSDTPIDVSFGSKMSGSARYTFGRNADAEAEID